MSDEENIAMGELVSIMEKEKIYDIDELIDFYKNKKHDSLHVVAGLIHKSKALVSEEFKTIILSIKMEALFEGASVGSALCSIGFIFKKYYGKDKAVLLKELEAWFRTMKHMVDVDYEL